MRKTCNFIHYSGSDGEPVECPQKGSCFVLNALQLCDSVIRYTGPMFPQPTVLEKSKEKKSKAKKSISDHSESKAKVKSICTC